MIRKVIIIGSGILSLCTIGYMMNLHLYLIGLDPSLNQLEIRSSFIFQQEIAYSNPKKFGTGDKNLILISGTGMDWTVFKPFIETNEDKYTMYAVNLFGHGDEPIPRKPEDYNDYYQTVYIDYNVEAIRNLINQKQLGEVTLVGYFMGAAQVVYKFSLKYPDIISNSVVIGGEVRRYPFSEKKRKEWVNDLANNFFKHIERNKWNQGKFNKEDWSNNEVIGKKYFDIDNDDPLPVLIQYTIESNAYDLTYYADGLEVPILAVTPDFTASHSDDQMTKYKAHGFVKEWEAISKSNEMITTKNIKNTRLALLEEKPEEISKLIQSFILSN